MTDVADELLVEMETLLDSCDCDSACSKCLKHYRNQYVHGRLDRKAALQFLRWGVDGVKASPLSKEEQIDILMPLADILKQAGCSIRTGDILTATFKTKTKELIIYPAMWVEPHEPNTIFVSDAYIKYAKPYAVQKILDDFH